jgi:hypothetical protein
MQKYQKKQNCKSDKRKIIYWKLLEDMKSTSCVKALPYTTLTLRSDTWGGVTVGATKAVTGARSTSSRKESLGAIMIDEVAVNKGWRRCSNYEKEENERLSTNSFCSSSAGFRFSVTKHREK